LLGNLGWQEASPERTSPSHPAPFLDPVAAAHSPTSAYASCRPRWTRQPAPPRNTF